MFGLNNLLTLTQRGAMSSSPSSSSPPMLTNHHRLPPTNNGDDDDDHVINDRTSQDNENKQDDNDDGGISNDEDCNDDDDDDEEEKDLLVLTFSKRTTTCSESARKGINGDNERIANVDNTTTTTTTTTPIASSIKRHPSRRVTLSAGGRCLDSPEAMTKRSRRPTRSNCNTSHDKHNDKDQEHNHKDHNDGCNDDDNNKNNTNRPSGDGASNGNEEAATTTTIKAQGTAEKAKEPSTLKSSKLSKSKANPKGTTTTVCNATKQAAPSSTTTTTTTSTSTTAFTKTKGKKRPTVLEQAQVLALETSACAITLAQAEYKRQCEQTKACFQQIKTKEAQLAKLQQELTLLHQQANTQKEREIKAKRDKVAAVRSHKTLQVKLQKAVQAAHETRSAKLDLQKQLQKALRHHEGVSTTPNKNNGHKRKRGQDEKITPAKKKTKKAQRLTDTTSSSNDKEKSDKPRAKGNSSDDDDDDEEDSDWEGAPKIKMMMIRKNSPADTTRHRQFRQPRPWSCPACTLENESFAKQCAVCRTTKPGTYIQEDDDDDDDSDLE